MLSGAKHLLLVVTEMAALHREFRTAQIPKGLVTLKILVQGFGNSRPSVRRHHHVLSVSRDPRN